MRGGYTYRSRASVARRLSRRPFCSLGHLTLLGFVRIDVIGLDHFWGDEGAASLGGGTRGAPSLRLRPGGASAYLLLLLARLALRSRQTKD